MIFSCCCGGASSGGNHHPSDDDSLQHVETPSKAATIVVNICGATCSGKSTLAEKLAIQLNSPIGPISLDSFITKSPPKCKFGNYLWENYECEQSINFLNFRKTIEQVKYLLENNVLGLSNNCQDKINMLKNQLMELGPIYWNDHYQYGNLNSVIYIIVEGFLSSCDSNIVNSLFDVNIFLDAEKDLCFKRRCQRDYNQMSNEFQDWFNLLVWPFYQVYRVKQLRNMIQSDKPLITIPIIESSTIHTINEKEIIQFIVNQSKTNQNIKHIPEWYTNLINDDSFDISHEEAELLSHNIESQ